MLSLRDALADISQQHLAKAHYEMSRRDGAIVAWHGVPGIAPPQKSRPVGYGVIGAFSVGVSQARSITSGSSPNIIGYEPFKKSI